MSMEAANQLARNIRVHDRVARKYDRRHGEIFNDAEQRRLREALTRARDGIRSGGLRAFDFGCGSGNLSRHLRELGFTVTSADVSEGFLALVRGRYPDVETHRLNGVDLAEIADGSFDLVATYSVLHHVPDYLAAVAEMARILKPGGVLYLDHEPSEDFWAQPDRHAAFRKAAMRPDWRKYLKPSNYWHKLRRLIDPRHTNEGDIHVWPDDHVEWPVIEALLEPLGVRLLFRDDFLLNHALYRAEVYQEAASTLADTRVTAFRKDGGAAA